MYPFRLNIVVGVALVGSTFGLACNGEISGSPTSEFANHVGTTPSDPRPSWDERDDAAAPVPPDPFGAVGTATLVDTVCTAATGVAFEFTPSSSAQFDRLGAVGGRYFAVSSLGERLVTFAGDGSDAGPVTNGFLTATSGGSSIATVALTNSFSLRLLDPVNLAPEAIVPLDINGVGRMTLASSGTSLLGLWVSGRDIVGLLFDTSGKPVAQVAFPPGSAGDFAMTQRIGIVWNGTDYVVAWPRQLRGGTLETLIARVDAAGRVATPSRLFETWSSWGWVDLAMTSEGYALLVNEAQPSGMTLVMLDANFAIVPPVRRFAGSRYGFGVAASPSGVGVVGKLADGRTAFRALGTDGQAVSPWVCLDDKPPTTPPVSFPPIPDAAITMDASGYALVAWMRSGASVFRRVDGTGAGVP